MENSETIDGVKKDETITSPETTEQIITDNNGKPHSKKKIVLIIVAVLLLVGICIGVTFCILNNNTKNNETHSSEDVSESEEKPIEHTEEKIDEPEIAKTAVLPTGFALNKRLCELSGSTSENDACEDKRIVSIKRAKSIPESKKTDKYDVTENDSETSVYFWYEQNAGAETGTIYYYSEAKTIYADKEFNGAFARLLALSDISGLADIDMSKVENVECLFCEDGKLKTVNALKDWDMSNVVRMSHMFMRAGLTDISGLAGWNVSKVKAFDGLFMEAYGVSDISALKNWDMSSAEDVSDMFNECSQIKDISAVSNWKTSTFEVIGGMFEGLTELKDITPLKNWDTSKVYHASSLFHGDESLSDITPIAKWNMKKLKASYGMFKDTNVYDATVLNSWEVPVLDFKEEMFNEGAKTPKWY
ncbi:BspA family leucine-rich repeat surface protein [Candidatus Saccharibacteria bacterium]|nr:BspA family leucine-rich repeat surface protein [Candidatus Saccharibacteria bacterium]